MRIFNEDKTIELQESEIDESLGELIPDTLFVRHVPYQAEVQQESHYEVIAEYPSGGKDVEEVIDIPYQPEVLEHDEYEDILVFKPFTEKVFAEKKVAELKGKLVDTDWVVIKINEMETEEEKQVLRKKYEAIIADRKAWRDEINNLEKVIKEN